jgi:hypothetical protein
MQLKEIKGDLKGLKERRDAAAKLNEVRILHRESSAEAHHSHEGSCVRGFSKELESRTEEIESLRRDHKVAEEVSR